MKRFAVRQDSLQLHRLFHQIGVDDYAYWLSAATPALTEGMNCNNLVYDCIDPCFDASYDQEHDKSEKEVVDKARIVFCTAHVLLERMLAWKKHSYLLPNACLTEECSPEHHLAMAAPDCLRNHKRPVVGFLGQMDSRFDFETIYEVARLSPDLTFVLAGPVRYDLETKAVKLKQLSNVLMPGLVSNLEGKQLTSAFDIGIIPFIPGPVCDAINPVKMYMYLAAGLPVVTTWINEAVQQMPLVTATRNAAEFSDALKKEVSMSDQAAKRRRIAFANDNTWDHRASVAINHFKQHGI